MEDAVSRAAVSGERHVQSLVRLAYQLTKELQDLNFLSPEGSLSATGTPAPSSLISNTPTGQSAHLQFFASGENPALEPHGQQLPPDSYTRIEALQRQYMEEHSHVIDQVKIICSQIHRIKPDAKKRPDNGSPDLLTLVERRDDLRKQVQEKNAAMKDLIDRIRDLQMYLNIIRGTPQSSMRGEVQKIKAIDPNPTTEEADNDDDFKEDEPLSIAASRAPNALSNASRAKRKS